jgi:hypothetical protein
VPIEKHLKDVLTTEIVKLQLSIPVALGQTLFYVVQDLPCTILITAHFLAVVYRISRAFIFLYNDINRNRLLTVAMAAELPSALEAIQQAIVTAPQRLLILQPVKPEDAITVQDVRPFVLVKGVLDNRRSIVRNIDLLVGFYAQRDIVFKAVYGKVECDFAMAAGTFHFAFDKKSMIPVGAIVFGDIRLVSDDINVGDAVTIVGAILQPKLKYALVINPSTWGGAGRTAIVKDGCIQF